MLVLVFRCCSNLLQLDILVLAVLTKACQSRHSTLDNAAAQKLEGRLGATVESACEQQRINAQQSGKQDGARSLMATKAGIACQPSHKIMLYNKHTTLLRCQKGGTQS